MKYEDYTYPLLGILAMISAGFFALGPVAPDDAYITYWSSYSLLEYNDILNYNLDEVEQSSSLLHVLVIYVVSLILNINVVYSGHLSGIVFGSLCIIATYIIEKDIGVDKYYATFLVSISPILSYWSFGGLETTLAAFCMTVWVYISYKYLSLSNYYVYLLFIFTVLLSAVRPEMVIFILCIAAYFAVYIVFKSQNRKKLAIFVFILVLASILPTLFRIVYFESLFPQPVYAKGGGILSLEGIKYGLTYLLGYNVFTEINLLGISPFSLIILSWFSAIIVAIYYNFWIKENYLLSILSLSLIVYGSFIVLSHADWMPARRFIVPILPVGSLLLSVVLNLDAFSRYSKSIFIVVLLSTMFSWVNVYSDSWRGVAYWDREEHLREHYEEHPDLSSRMWFEKYSRKFIRKYKKYEMLLGGVKNESKNVLINEAGIPLFYLAKNHRYKVGILADMHGLFHKMFDNCGPLERFKSNQYGMMISRSYVMLNADVLEKECSLPVFNIVSYMNQNNDSFRALLETNNYDVVTGTNTSEVLLLRRQTDN